MRVARGESGQYPFQNTKKPSQVPGRVFLSTGPGNPEPILGSGGLGIDGIHGGAYRDPCRSSRFWSFGFRYLPVEIHRIYLSRLFSVSYVDACGSKRFTVFWIFPHTYPPSP